jgi:hypothetical protein
MVQKKKKKKKEGNAYGLPLPMGDKIKNESTEVIKCV